jgi:hypothetical protein
MLKPRTFGTRQVQHDMVGFAKGSYSDKIGKVGEGVASATFSNLDGEQSLLLGV